MANEAPRLNILTPRGRLVSGNLHTASDEGYQGQKRKVAQYFFALAVPKNEPGVNELLGAIVNHAFASHAQNAVMLQRMQSGMIGVAIPQGFKPPFAWKISDGDSPKHADKDGWRGCWVFKFSTSQPFGVCDAQLRQFDPKLVPLGLFARVSGNVQINGLVDDNAGIYLNPNNVQILDDDGTRITPGQSAEAAFGGAPAAIPAGAQAWSPTATPAPATPGAPQAGFVPQQPAYAPPAAAPMPPAPVAQVQPVAPTPTASAQPTAEQIAAHYRVQHHPGWRFNPATGGYEPDAAPPPVQPPAPVGNHAYAPAAPAYAPGVPAPQPAPAPHIGALQGSTTAFPSNPPSAGVGMMPGIQPHPAFLTPGAPR